MPCYCCVPNCSSNKTGQPYVSVFRFPKDEQLLQTWKKPGLNVTPGLSTLANENYLRGRCKVLKDDEKQVILQIDEIFIKSAITYKCNKIIGFTEKGEAATMIQCFLYSSLLSKNKEIVSLNPVKNMNAEDLYSMTLEILSLMEKWLDCWKNLKQNKREGCLNEETFFALRHTVNTILELIKYLLTEQNFKYVLTGKFQTDNLEARFGQYRQMSGANYHVTAGNFAS
ncbi:transposable element P transposase [Trichonephila clavipes]|nr:transposable element P transposase [Trichonephila clavipes]